MNKEETFTLKEQLCQQLKNKHGQICQLIIN